MDLEPRRAKQQSKNTLPLAGKKVTPEDFERLKKLHVDFEAGPLREMPKESPPIATKSGAKFNP